MRPCIICGTKEQPKLTKEEERTADLLLDWLSEAADIEGPSVLSDSDLDFICGKICDKCILKIKKRRGHTRNGVMFL